MVILLYFQLVSYKYFWHGIHRTVLARRKYATAPTYLYRFDFDSKHFNLMRIITCGRKVRGTCHADDLSYLFYNAGAKKLKYRSAEYTTIRRMVAILVKFAECGDPNIPLTDAVCWPALNGCDPSNGSHKRQQKEIQTNGKDTNTTATIDAVADQTDNKQQNGDTNSSNNNANGGCDVGENDDTPANGDEDIYVNSENEDDEDDDDVGVAVIDDAIVSNCVNNSSTTDILLQQDEKQQQHHHHYWPQISCSDDDSTTFKCLNISDELEVIDLPEAEKLKLWDSMYEDKSLLY